VEKMMLIVPEFISMNSYYGNSKNNKTVKKLGLTEPILNTHSVLNKDRQIIRRDVAEPELNIK
jgi:hypothetical protein